MQHSGCRTSQTWFCQNNTFTHSFTFPDYDRPAISLPWSALYQQLFVTHLNWLHTYFWHVAEAKKVNLPLPAGNGPQRINVVSAILSRRQHIWCTNAWTILMIYRSLWNTGIDWQHVHCLSPVFSAIRGDYIIDSRPRLFFFFFAPLNPAWYSVLAWLWPPASHSLNPQNCLRCHENMKAKMLPVCLPPFFKKKKRKEKTRKTEDTAMRWSNFAGFLEQMKASKALSRPGWKWTWLCAVFTLWFPIINLVSLRICFIPATADVYPVSVSVETDTHPTNRERERESILALIYLNPFDKGINSPIWGQSDKSEVQTM